MASISIDVLDELKKEMAKFPNGDRTGLINMTIRERLLFLKKFDKTTDKSNLTEDDTIEIGQKMN